MKKSRNCWVIRDSLTGDYYTDADLYVGKGAFEEAFLYHTKENAKNASKKKIWLYKHFIKHDPCPTEECKKRYALKNFGMKIIELVATIKEKQ